tara:strand:+ start:9 stop:209 length:201 start_codon:yes stop_codon:yes gene_type:complete
LQEVLRENEQDYPDHQTCNPSRGAIVQLGTSFENSHAVHARGEGNLGAMLLSNLLGFDENDQSRFA